MELFLKVVYQILSPVQAALFIVEAFPYHCDSLAMANVLSTMSKVSNGADLKMLDPGKMPSSKVGTVECDVKVDPDVMREKMETMLSRLEASRNI